MKRFDLYLRSQRIKKVLPFIAEGARVLDIGCSEGRLFENLPSRATGVGIDPGLGNVPQIHGFTFIKGFFPTDLPDAQLFDVITMTAVLEHFPENQQLPLAMDCAKWLKPGGRVVITVPSPWVDPILHVLQFIRFMDAEALEQHYGFDARKTPDIFGAAGLRLIIHKRFQLGLNNLFVFEKS